MTQLNYQPVPMALPFPSQKGGLIAFGVIFLIIGLFVLMGAASLPLAMVMSPTRLPLGMLISIEAMYLGVAGLFVFAGIDCIRARRWVRPVAIVAGTLGLLGGVLGVASIAINWHTMMNITVTQSGTTMAAPGAMIGLIVGLVFASIFYVILPGLVVWFFRRHAVLQTVQYFDPSPSWTDGKPLSLIAVILIEALAGAFSPMMLMYGHFPIFTVLLTGVAAVLCCLIVAAAHLYSAVLLLKRNETGIWIAMGMSILQLASFATAIAHHGYSRLFDVRMIQNSASRGGAIEINNAFEPSMPFMYTTWGIMLVLWCLFLLYTRKHMHTNTAAGEIAAS